MVEFSTWHQRRPGSFTRQQPFEMPSNSDRHRLQRPERLPLKRRRTVTKERKKLGPRLVQTSGIGNTVARFEVFSDQTISDYKHLVLRLKKQRKRTVGNRHTQGPFSDVFYSI